MLPDFLDIFLIFDIEMTFWHNRAMLGYDTL